MNIKKQNIPKLKNSAVSIEKLLTEDTRQVNANNLTQDIEKAWLHDVFVCGDLIKQPKRAEDYRFMYKSNGYGYFNNLISWCKELCRLITKHDCADSIKIDTLLNHIIKIRFIGDLKSVKYPLCTIDSVATASLILANFFEKNGLKWKCPAHLVEPLKASSIFFKTLYDKGLIKVL